MPRGCRSRDGGADPATLLAQLQTGITTITNNAALTAEEKELATKVGDCEPQRRELGSSVARAAETIAVLSAVTA